MGSVAQVEPPPHEGLKSFTTLNDVLETRALTHPDRPLISYPKNETDIVDYTGAELDRLTRRVAVHTAQVLGERDLNPGDRLDQRRLVVAIVGISSFEYYLTFLSLQRLGITTVFISPRLADAGYIHLLKETRCDIAIASGPSFTTLERLRENGSLSENFTLLPMIDSQFLYAECGTIDSSDFKPLCFEPAPGFIIHSGGTTGLPKPVPLAASAWLAQASDIVRRIPRVDTLSTLPLFHSFGLATLLRGLVSGTRLSLFNASRPVTAANVIKCLNNTSSEALVTVPYTLKFLVEADGGLERLGALRQVINAGSAIPDDLGDKVVTAGGNIFHLYGQTECGALMEPPSDRRLWSWVTPLPHAKSYLQFEPESSYASQDIYHLVILPGLKQKVLSDRPDGSYGTKDLFQRHPTIPDLWKFVARKDDIIVMLNGEKADPIPVEDAVKINPEVATAVVFGAGQEALGLVVIKSHSSATLSHAEFVKAIGASLDLGNSRVPAYARIARDMIIVKEAGTLFPATDKGTVIRSAFLKEMHEDIEKLYSDRSAGKLKSPDTGAPMSYNEVLAIVSEIVKHELQSKKAHDISTTSERTAVDEIKSLDDLSFDTDLFDLGVDSLQASNIRSRIQRGIDLRGVSLATNVVFDYPTIALLGGHVMHLHLGNNTHPELADPEQLARAMAEKFSTFASTEPGAEVVNAPTEAKTVLLTGATGQVGAHLLFSLLSRPDVKSVLCLVRAQNSWDGLTRLHMSLSDAGLLADLSTTQLEKIEACPGDLSDPKGCFSPSDPVYSRILNTVTTIIHNAWPVNFNLSFQSFEAQAIRPTHHLINLAIRSHLRPKPTFTFVSSVSTVLNAPGPEVLEKPYPWESVGSMGYGQSKWVAEQILAAAATGDHGLESVRVARLGQVVGDTRLGRWKTSEAYPAVAQSALTVGALPLIEAASDGLVHDEHFWLPVDAVGAAIADVALCRGDERNDPPTPVSYFNISSAVPMRWNSDFAPAVKECLAQYGILCELLPQREWLRCLEESDPDITTNPPRKLLDFFRRRYGRLESSGLNLQSLLHVNYANPSADTIAWVANIQQMFASHQDIPPLMPPQYIEQALHAPVVMQTMSAFLAEHFPDEYPQVCIRNFPMILYVDKLPKDDSSAGDIEDDDSPRTSDDESDSEEIEYEKVEVEAEPDQLEVLARLTGTQL
ncbi:putative NRPS-like protein biosynthetic cluster [Diaporthe australafricana]|uniref:NRPS-like protein biosynthetic cluster n=1 Tax=Diaporthe australafricana TaxID=127596 RepID=A0ABR3VWE7_9PEZI